MLIFPSGTNRTSVARKGYTVYAADIDLGHNLQKLETPHRHRLDVSSPSSISDFAKEFGDQPLDILLNVAGECCSFPDLLGSAHLYGSAYLNGFCLNDDCRQASCLRRIRSPPSLTTSSLAPSQSTPSALSS